MVLDTLHRKGVWEAFGEVKRTFHGVRMEWKIYKETWKTFELVFEDGKSGCRMGNRLSLREECGIGHFHFHFHFHRPPSPKNYLPK